MIELLSIFPVSALILAMPGPTNTLLFSSSLMRGFAASVPLIATELVAYGIAISAWGMLLQGLMAQHAWIALVLKLSAALYVAWLATKIWRFQSSPAVQPAISRRQVFTTTLLNPKAFLFATFVMPQNVFASPTVWAAGMGAFAAALVPVSVGWCLLGCSLHSGRHHRPLIPAHVMLRGAAIALCGFSLSIFYDAIRAVA